MLLVLLILSKVYYRDQFAAKPYERAAAAAAASIERTAMIAILFLSKVYYHNPGC